MNNTQVEAAAKAWLRAAGQDILHRICSFRHQNPSVRMEDIKDMFGLNTCNMDDVLHGNILGISAADLIKLFVASGLALDIKPIDEAIKEMEAEKHKESSNNDVNNTTDTHTHSSTQPRDRFGRFVSRHANEGSRTRTNCEEDTNTYEQDNPYVSMPNEDLIRIIQMNLWDTEIDVYNASHKDLVDFLMKKERAFAENHRFQDNDSKRDNKSHRSTNVEREIPVEEVHTRNASRCERRFSEPSVAGSHDNVSDFVKGITDFLENNPDISSQIAKILNK